MKLIVIRDNLKEGLNVIGYSISNNLPILSNFFIEAEDNKIKFISTNLETAIIYETQCKVIEKGKIVIPFSKFYDLINNLASEERINLEKKQKKVEISAGSYQAVMNIDNNVEDFPVIPQIKNKNYIEINSLLIKDILNKLIVSASGQNLRPELETILFNINNENFKLVSTDSFRLTEKTLLPSVYQNSNKEDIKCLIPLKTAQILTSIIGSKNESLKIYIDENQILFKSKNWELISRLIENNYPDYSNIIPKKFKTEISLNLNKILEALKLSSIFSNESFEVGLKIKNKNLEIYSSNQIIGENKYILEAKVKGEEVDINFNWKYLLDGLKIFKDSEEIFIGINNFNQPAIIKSINDDSLFYLLMPIVK